jgi:LPS sulfotransferase NodH
LRGYVIAATPRSGSNFLGQALASTGVLGRPLEYFNAPGRRALEAPDFPDAVADQVQWILTRGATANGVYALKAFPDQFSAALRQVDLFAHLPGLQFVRLVRRDLLGQAISWARALQTQQYRSTQTPMSAPRYDGRLIAKLMVDIACANVSWAVYLARTGIEAPILFYEDVEADPAGAVQQIAARVEVDGARIDPALVDLKRQRDAESEAWRARYIAEQGVRSHLPLLTA